MASHLETELGKLRGIIIKIGGLAESQVAEAVKSVLSEPVSEGKEVKKTENKIDKLDVKIDDICQSVFALQQPVASDLRFIISAMQMSKEIERIGDLSMSIIKLSKSIKEKHELISKFNITEISREVETITAKTNECFESMDESTIDEIFVLNNSIKSKSTEATQNIIAEMKNNSKTVMSGTNLIIALKHFDRIADHCTNIAESVYFMINAKTIKHEKNIDKK
ncbi:phosphate signaling complex protein PhoU [Flavobacterium degerlachei]|jgi:phosphate transport system protein|uniref:Phosphate-specific transport system accessory protein PhoU n=1 Tax=Flavobacterium degerlachei TaxID=229203 RepID=A0A1H3D9R4_9FLAO|nr:phosphate signaling complex protein PhoU [Flavobacterium degerlachei]SDX62888.1 phosphate uptake regulator, PhoU [Flavobacterium degerlachei]